MSINLKPRVWTLALAALSAVVLSATASAPAWAYGGVSVTFGDPYSGAYLSVPIGGYHHGYHPYRYPQPYAYAGYPYGYPGYGYGYAPYRYYAPPRWAPPPFYFGQRWHEPRWRDYRWRDNHWRDDDRWRDHRWRDDDRWRDHRWH